MSEEMKNNQPLNDSELDSANGGLNIADLPGAPNYFKAGVLVMNISSNGVCSSSYTYNGTVISKECADAVLAYYAERGQRCPADVFQELQAKYSR